MNSVTAHAAVSKQSVPDHAARYETLRAWAAHRNPSASRDGLVVLLRQGVAAWMDAWSRLPAPPAQDERQQPSPLPNDVCTEVIRVLAAMTIGHIQEVHA
jgi:hypothetical protein